MCVAQGQVDIASAAGVYRPESMSVVRTRPNAPFHGGTIKVDSITIFIRGHFMIRLRGHHLLCLLGYRGMGYSKEYVENMTRLHQTLRSEPDTQVHLVLGPDDLCEKFPSNQPCHCEDDNVYVRDAAILHKLNLELKQTLTWRKLEKRISATMHPNDIVHLCSTCSWRSYGVCEEGIQLIQSGEGLPHIQ